MEETENTTPEAVEPAAPPTEAPNINTEPIEDPANAPAPPAEATPPVEGATKSDKPGEDEAAAIAEIEAPSVKEQLLAAVQDGSLTVESLRGRVSAIATKME